MHTPFAEPPLGARKYNWKNTNGDGTNGDGTFSDLWSQRAHTKKLLLSRYGPDEPKTKKVPSPFVPSPFVSFRTSARLSSSFLGNGTFVCSMGLRFLGAFLENGKNTTG